MPKLPNETLAHGAYLELKKRILAGFFTGRDRLREIEVADELELGRTPVREALKRLQDEGLLTQEPRRGLVVTSLDPQSVSELYAMREALEGTAAGFAARHATEAEIFNMAAILAEQKAGGDPVQCNLAFHQAIYSAAHNRYLIRALQSLTDSTYLLGRSTLSNPVRAALALDEHQRILAAIQSGDAQAASVAAGAHIQQALLMRLKMLRQKSSDASSGEPRILSR